MLHLAGKASSRRRPVNSALGRMTHRSRIATVRWVIIGIMLTCMYLAGHGALMMYFMKTTGGLESFRPASAEAVSRQAAPYQASTPETNGLFKIVQRQHSELGLMFNRLEAAEEVNWALLHVGTVAFLLLSVGAGVCLVLLPRQSKGNLPQAAQGGGNQNAA
jgi:hypothetical protein